VTLEQSALLLSWIAIVLLALGMSGLLRHVVDLRAQLSQGGFGGILRPGLQAPRIPELGDWSRPSLLIFADADCPVCRSLTPTIEALAAAHGECEFMVLYPREAPVEDRFGPRILSNQRAIFDEYRIGFTPFAVGVGEAGLVTDMAPVGSERLLVQFVEAFTSRRSVTV
jgi:hypothetical protein